MLDIVVKHAQKGFEKCAVMAFLHMLFAFLGHEDRFLKLVPWQGLLLVMVLVIAYNMLMHNKFGHAGGPNKILAICSVLLLVLAVLETAGTEATGQLMKTLVDAVTMGLCEIIRTVIPQGIGTGVMLFGIVFAFLFRVLTFGERMVAAPAVQAVGMAYLQAGTPEHARIGSS
jgi:hypothetical protein